MWVSSAIDGEHVVVRVVRPAQVVDDRRDDGQDDALLDTDQDDGECSRPVATMNSSGRSRRILRMPGDVDELDPDQEHDRSEHGVRHVLEWLGEEQQDDDGDGTGGDLGELAAATGTVDHLGLGGAAVDGERAREAGGDAGQAETDEVGVLVERLVVLGRVGARCGSALGQDEHEDGEGGWHQLADLGQRDALGEAELGQATRHRAEGRHAVSRQVGGLADHHRADDRDQRTGNLRDELLAAEDDRRCTDSETHERRDAGVGNVLDGAPQLLAGCRPWRGHADHPGELTDGHLDADTGEEPDEHGAGEEVGDEAELDQRAPGSAGRRP